MFENKLGRCKGEVWAQLWLGGKSLILYAFDLFVNLPLQGGYYPLDSLESPQSQVCNTLVSVEQEVTLSLSLCFSVADTLACLLMCVWLTLQQDSKARSLPDFKETNYIAGNAYEIDRNKPTNILHIVHPEHC